MSFFWVVNTPFRESKWAAIRNKFFPIWVGSALKRDHLNSPDIHSGFLLLAVKNSKCHYWGEIVAGVFWFLLTVLDHDFLLQFCSFTNSTKINLRLESHTTLNALSIVAFIQSFLIFLTFIFWYEISPVEIDVFSNRTTSKVNNQKWEGGFQSSDSVDVFI